MAGPEMNALWRFRARLPADSLIVFPRPIPAPAGVRLDDSQHAEGIAQIDDLVQPAQSLLREVDAGG